MFASICVMTEVSTVNHGLRHSMASRMINQGVNILVVSKHLRHASTQQTLNTYAHLFPNLNKDIIDKLV